MSARVPSELLVTSLTAPPLAAPPPVAGEPKAAAGGDGRANSPGCVVAQDLYYREARSYSVWSVLTWTLGAATVVFAIFVLFFLLSLLTQTSDAVDKAVKVVGTVGSAAATFIGGVAWKFVFEQLKDQRLAVTDAGTTVGKECGSVTEKHAKDEVTKARHKPLGV